MAAGRSVASAADGTAQTCPRAAQPLIHALALELDLDLDLDLTPGSEVLLSLVASSLTRPVVSLVCWMTATVALHNVGTPCTPAANNCSARPEIRK